MVRILGLCGMLAVVLAWPVQAQSDPCQAAEREMAYGAAAVEDSKDKAGFLRAARQFEGATRSAPRCAAARFNLGVAYEKAGQLQAAKDAYGHYLRLAPNAPDARAVRQRMYKLEYRVGRAKARTNLAGSWEDKSLKNRYRIDMAGPRFDIYHISYCPWQDCSKRR